MSSFGRNIDNLRSANATNTSLANAYENENASAIASTKQYEARKIAEGLSSFSKSLKEWKIQNIKDEQEKGQQDFHEFKQVNAEKLVTLQEQLDKAKDNKIETERIKSEMLTLSGPDGKAEADRIGQLSPWGQVGFVREKLKLFNDSIEDKLKYHMQNSERAISLQGVTFTPKQLREHNITGAPMKEAALQVVTSELMKDAGIDKYSPEMLQLAGTYDAINKAKETELAQIRKRYNIDSSAKQQAELTLDWDSSKKTGKDLWAFVLGVSNTTNGEGQLHRNTGGWDFVMKHIAKEGIASTDRGAYVEMIGNLVLPDELCDQLGIPHGTQFRKQYPKRLEALRSAVKKGFTDTVNSEKKYLKAQQDHVGNNFQKRAQEGPISEQELEQWQLMSEKYGGVLDDRIKNYRTISDKDYETSKKDIEDLEASQGFLTHADLDKENPTAALGFREKATRYEKAFKDQHRVNDTIESALSESWTQAGIKTKEKPVIWQQSLRRAVEDYDRKFSQLVGMGFDRKAAMKIALEGNAADLVHPETKEPIPELADFEGVVSEIQRNGANSKYTKESERAKNEMSESMLRFWEVNKAKVEIAKNTADGKELNTYVIGGEYGQKQIQDIISKEGYYGIWGAIENSPEAKMYYQSIARGKRGWNAHSVIDAQLKAAGHPGLWPDRKLPTDNEKLDANVNQAEEKISSIVEQTKVEGGSIVAYNQLTNDVEDMRNLRTSQPSVWNQPQNLSEAIA